MVQMFVTVYYYSYDAIFKFSFDIGYISDLHFSKIISLCHNKYNIYMIKNVKVNNIMWSFEIQWLTLQFKRGGSFYIATK